MLDGAPVCDRDSFGRIACIPSIANLVLLNGNCSLFGRYKITLKTPTAIYWSDRRLLPMLRRRSMGSIPAVVSCLVYPALT